jgi:anaerobic carbon-monoxide dehydrogenase iron sulfur subunit
MTTSLADSTIAPATRHELLTLTTRQFVGDILVEPAKCNGCLECVEACRNKMAAQHTEASPLPRIAIHSLDGLNIPLLCHNCAEAPCAVACMTGCRIRTAGGWVETDYARCVGCWMCVMACPFGAIVPVYEEGMARKCDGCVEDLIPACAAACKPGALHRGGQYDLSQERRQAFAPRFVLSSER